jgi:uncharacterized OB-fold protein
VSADFDPRTLPPPQPLPDSDSAGFWEATADGRVALCRCQECGHWHHPPLERCRRCAGPTDFEPIAGTGSVHTYIVQRQGAVAGYLDELPYVVALVELDEQPGLRLPGRLADIDPVDVCIGQRVRARVVAHPGGDYAVPVFEAC